MVGLISLLCNCSSSNNGGSTAPPSAVTSVSPLSDSSTALVTTDVAALFLDEMDTVSVESAFSLRLNSNPVAATVSYDDITKIARLSSDIDLASGTEYRATIAASVKDINGESPLSSDFVWSFTISPAMLLTSNNASGVTANDISKAADIDATGRYIVFESEATNLTSIGTTFNRSHIYRKDTVTGDVILVSSDKTGLLEANNKSSNPSISTNGRYIVFESNATNLDATIFVSPNGPSQIYLKDLEDGSVDLVSRSAVLAPDNSFKGATNASVSENGRYIIFQSADNDLSAIDGNTFTQVYLKDMSDESVEMISRSAMDAAGNGASGNPDMSADGSHIVFESSATNFPASIGVNHIYYVNTSEVHTLEQISVATNGTEANADSNKPSISDDGSTIVFHSKDDNLDGLDNNGFADVYLHYRPLVVTRLISVTPSGDSGDSASSNAHISGNADYVVFESLALDLASGGVSGIRSIFVRDLSALPGIIVEKLDMPSSTLPSNGPAISTDGRYVSFDSVEGYADDTDTLSDVFRVHNSAHP